METRIKLHKVMTMNSRSIIISFDANIKQQAKEDPFNMFGDSHTNTKAKVNQPNNDFLDLI